MARRPLWGVAVALALVSGACGGGDDRPTPASIGATGTTGWPHANLDLQGSRATGDSAISSSTVGDLEEVWRVEVPGGGAAGSLATTPVIADGVVWFSDLNSNVYGVDLDDGTEVLTIRNDAANFGPNGVAVGSGRVFAAPDAQSVAAYDRTTGAELWRKGLVDLKGGNVNIQPLLVEDRLLVATSALAKPGSRGTLYALDAATGAIEWEFDTIESPDLWGRPDINSGGGSWSPPAVDVAARRVYWGTSNPYPWPGVTEFPNGSSRPGDNKWTNSTLALDLDSGRLLWGHQHRAHDLFDLDSTLTALTVVDGRQVVVSSGKFGRVVSLDPADGKVLGNTAVGVHENDDAQRVDGDLVVYPGYVGGVTTPMAVVDGVAYVAVVNAPSELPFPPIDFRPEAPNFAVRDGQMIAVNLADGGIRWEVDVAGQPFGAATVVNDLVFGSTLTGELFALDRDKGTSVWSTQLETGINAWPAVAGDTIVVPAGVKTGDQAPQLVAYRLRR